MDNIVAVHRFAVDGDNAEKIYEIFRKSYFVVNRYQPFKDGCVQVEIDFADGVFRVEEKTTEQISYIADIIYFFADTENMFSMSEYIEDGIVQSYSVDDAEGKYFVRPPKTEWELQMEERENQRRERNDDDLPF